jgi:hypothetical protein
MDAMSTESKKNQGERKISDGKKKQVSLEEKEDKDTTLAKRSGQRPALPFTRKRLP